MSCFAEEIESVVDRYENKQLSSAQVVERLVEIAKRCVTPVGGTSNLA